VLTDQELSPLVDQALTGVDIPELGQKTRGKVRDIYRRTRNGIEELILITTDRLSAFDRVLGLVPYKGQVLTQLSAFWFEQTRHIAPNHILPNEQEILRDRLRLSRDSQLRSMAARKLQPLAIECVVRGYLAGSGWAEYRRTGAVCGIHLPEGLLESDRLPEPIRKYTQSIEDADHLSFVQGGGHGEFTIGVMQDGHAVVVLALVVVGLLPEQVAVGVVLGQQHVRALARHEGIAGGVEVTTTIGGRGRPSHRVGQAVLGHPRAVDQGLGHGAA